MIWISGESLVGFWTGSAGVLSVSWTLNGGGSLVVFWTGIAFDSLEMLLIEIFAESRMSWTSTVSD